MGTLKGDNKNNILQPNPFSGDAVFKIYGYGGNDQIFGHASAHNIIDGGSGNDRIMGGSFKNTISGGAGHDDIMAGDGRDVITGGTGYDRMYGMGGGDRFVFKTVGEIGKAEGARDVIEDFKLGSFNGRDKIDLSQIDAKTGTAKNDAFVFNAKEGADFTGKKGELIWSSERVGSGSGAALVKGDVNGDGKADFVLEVSGYMDLYKGDFIL
jgi:Ca2+-binding RTX toxin-like protein